ncbi:MAG: 4Fe-4S dicluster domain-containing protein [Bacteroidota bacterium]|nr:MAG: 4Fe-4S dicluster domain-containing protein [Bacteroidota bacterium]
MQEKHIPEETNPAQSNEPIDSRREFLKRFGLVGAAAAAGTAAIYTGYVFEKKKGKDEYITVLTADNKLVKVPKAQIEEVTIDKASLQSRGRVGLEGRRFVMVIDLAKCRNARKCIESCQEAHHLRPHEYHINTLKMQDSPTTAPYFMPKPCQHCDNPPCVSVCPVDATFKRQDGIVLIDNQRCIGCRFCMAACPYSARMFHWEEPLFTEEVNKKSLEYEELVKKGAGNTDLAQLLKKEITYDVELNTPQKKGTISKCLFSADRLRENKLPYCVSACPNGVFYFGDENEDAVTNGTTKETFVLSSLLKDNAGYRLMEELGTKPRIYYLPPKNRLFDVPEEDVNAIIPDPHA